MNLSVTSLIRYLKNRLDTDPNLQNINVSGELSNFRSSVSGHLYFTLKDENAAISCVMFASKVRSLKFRPVNGDKVIVSGSISMFESSGSLQLYVSTLRKNGVGDLYQQYEELKNRLLEEGLFENAHKKIIRTRYPERIAVLCGDESAALSDIRTCFNRRWPLAIYEVYPVIVQGSEAPLSIIKALRDADRKDYDAIILARGGGSFEDLFCFNDERLIREIYDLKTFIISGVGHEQDFTLTDFVADLRAPTPTAAVELITPDIKVINKELDRHTTVLENTMNKKLLEADNNLSLILSRHIYTDPASIFDKHRLKIDVLAARLKNFNQKTKTISSEIVMHEKNMKGSLLNKINILSQQIEAGMALLKAYSIDKTLERGFSLIYKDGHLLHSKEDVKAGDDITLKLADGSINATVKE